MTHRSSASGVYPYDIVVTLGHGRLSAYPDSSPTVLGGEKHVIVFRKWRSAWQLGLPEHEARQRHCSRGPAGKCQVAQRSVISCTACHYL